MGRQYRTPRAPGVTGGHFREFVGPTPGSTVATLNLGGAHTIPSYGVTDISTWGASTYLMAPPEQGCMKTILSRSSSGAARVIKLSTANTVTVGYNTPTTGASGNTHLSFGASTADVCVTLMGADSTHWVIVSAYPTTASTGFVGIVST